MMHNATLRCAMHHICSIIKAIIRTIHSISYIKAML